MKIKKCIVLPLVAFLGGMVLASTYSSWGRAVPFLPHAEEGELFDSRSLPDVAKTCRKILETTNKESFKERFQACLNLYPDAH